MSVLIVACLVFCLFIIFFGGYLFGVFVFVCVLVCLLCVCLIKVVQVQVLQVNYSVRKVVMATLL